MFESPIVQRRQNMSGDAPPARKRVLLRKYQNRRYYDSSRSLHVTLEDIFNLVRGDDIQVTDSKTGEDITPTVLAQIILEHDPLKLGVFPVELLHHIIRVNEPLIRDFIDRYFNQFLGLLRVAAAVQPLPAPGHGAGRLVARRRQRVFR